MKPEIVVVGSLNVDLVVRAPRFPAPGETVIGGEFRTALGGKGANQAVAAARLGGKVSMVGMVGDDQYGKAQLEALADEGIDTEFVGIAEGTHTGVALIVVDDSGQNSIVVSPGANHVFSVGDVRKAKAALERAQMLVMQLEIVQGAVETAISIAKSAGVPVLLNPAPARKLGEDVLSRVDYLILNETEAEMLSGMSVDDLEGAREAAERLCDSGAGTVVVTLGAHGAYLLGDGVSFHMPAFRVKPVDTTAAGDAFVGGFAVAVASGVPLHEAARFASAAGALATTKMGAQPSLPTAEEVRGLVGS